MCSYFEISRSCYYKQLRTAERISLEESAVVSLVQKLRCQMKHIGGKKLYWLLKDDLQSVGKIGRDKFLKILKKHHLQVERKRSYTRTTDSYHRYYCWKNQIKGRSFDSPNQCWVSDITDLRTMKGFVLSMTTDVYSRKIVGWSLSESLSIEGSMNTLQMALRQRKDKSSALIHHSDRGVQYCSNAYVSLLQKHGISISMTEENHCYENSIAERVNGILKGEFMLDDLFKDHQDAQQAVKDAIRIYNNCRPHWSLNLKTPQQMHLAA